MEKEQLVDSARELANQANSVAIQAERVLGQVNQLVLQAEQTTSMSFLSLFTVFVLACFVGYYVVWNVTPALHSPLMGVTNAISSVIIVGALIAAGPVDMNLSKIFGFVAVVLASVNIFGGFIVTQRMLQMFKKKPKS